MLRKAMVLGAVTAAVVLGQESPAQLIGRARLRMQQNMARQPNYTCLETVQRTRRAPGSYLQVEDTLRLEVAMADGREMFAWPGGKRFDDKDVAQIVSSGMFGSGSYGVWARMLFVDDGPVLEAAGSGQIRGKRAVKFKYRVPQKDSAHRVKVDANSAIVGYHGVVYIDPESADLWRLEVTADDIPRELGLNDMEEQIDYARVKIAEEDEPLLIPVESRLKMVSAQSISENQVRYSNCRKFAGESSLIVGEPGEAQSAEAAIQEIRVPGRIELKVEFRESLPLEEQAAGDEVKAVLLEDVLFDDADGNRVLAPKGAIARGRILMLERTASLSQTEIRFYDLEWPGAHAGFSASLLGAGGFIPAGLLKIIEFQPTGIIRFKTSKLPDLKNVRLRYVTLP